MGIISYISVISCSSQSDHCDMKQLVSIVIAIVVASVAFLSCSQPRYPHSLLMADSLAEVRPDSAVALLNRLRPQIESEGRAVRMYHRLLTIKAADKADLLEPCTDSILPIVAYYEGRGDKSLLPVAYYYAGRTYYELHDAPQALDYFQKAAETAGEDWALRSRIFSHIGYIFINQGLYSEAQQPFREQYHSSLRGNDMVDMVYALRDLAISLEAENEHQESLDTLKSAYSMAKKSGDQHAVRSIELALANQYKHMGKPDSSLRFVRPIRESIPMLSKSVVYSTLFGIYKASTHTDSAFYYARLMEAEGNAYAKDSASKYLTRYYLERGDASQAAKHYLTYLSYDDSIREITRTREVARVNALYNYQQREKENARLRKEKQRVASALCFSLLILMVMAYFALLYRKRLKRMSLMQRLSEQLKESDERRQRAIGSSNEDHPAETTETDAMLSEWRRNEKIRLKQSGLYRKFFAHAEESLPLKSDDWAALENLLDAECDNFAVRLRVMCNLSERDYRMCFLLRLRMPVMQISKILNVDKSSISSQRRRLYKKHTGRAGSAKDWDAFILSL